MGGIRGAVAGREESLFCDSDLAQQRAISVFRDRRRRARVRPLPIYRRHHHRRADVSARRRAGRDRGQGPRHHRRVAVGQDHQVVSPRDVAVQGKR